VGCGGTGCDKNDKIFQKYDEQTQIKNTSTKISTTKNTSGLVLFRIANFVSEMRGGSGSDRMCRCGSAPAPANGISLFVPHQLPFLAIPGVGLLIATSHQPPATSHLPPAAS
jgi:hypothetical protein